MSYNAQISRDFPTCMIFLIDQSGSMSDPIGGSVENKSKAQGVADAINKFMGNLINKCVKELGQPPRNYFDVAVIGYGSSVISAFGGGLTGQEWAKVSEIAANCLKVVKKTRKTEDGAGGLVDETINTQVWFEPKATGGTPMCEALDMVIRMLSTWIPAHPASFPPIVINITDGESTDGSPIAKAEAIRSMTTDDGGVLFFNCDISSQEGAKVIFPDTDEGIPNVKYERDLFSMSSELPPEMLKAAQQLFSEIKPGARGFAFKADLAELIQFLDIGTKVTLR